MLRFSFLFLLLGVIGCQDNSDEGPAHMRVRGETMGTYYAISYLDEAGREFQVQFDSVLKVINDGVSTYIPTSVISQFNKSESGIDLGMDYSKMMENAIPGKGNPGDKYWHMARNYYLSKDIQNTIGPAFDPTVMPLVNYWGFGYTEKRAVETIDSSLVDSLRNLVGLDQVIMEGSQLVKSAPGVQLDFSAVAKGYAVDELGRFLELKGIQDYLVDIGGEVRGRGKSSRGDYWKIGINTPSSKAALTDVELLVSLADKSLATSGNYRNFHEIDGRKYAHTINPETGYPEQSNLLSASVFSEECALSDGLATAFMVMGLEDAKAIVAALSNVEACLIYGNEDGSYGVFISPGIEKYINQE